MSSIKCVKRKAECFSTPLFLSDSRGGLLLRRRILTFDCSREPKQSSSVQTQVSVCPPSPSVRASEHVCCYRRSQHDTLRIFMLPHSLPLFLRCSPKETVAGKHQAWNTVGRDSCTHSYPPTPHQTQTGSFFPVPFFARSLSMSPTLF